MEEELVYFDPTDDDWYYADLYNKLEEDKDNE